MNIVLVRFFVQVTDTMFLEAMDSKLKKNDFYSSRGKNPSDRSLEHAKHFRINHYAGLGREI